LLPRQTDVIFIVTPFGAQQDGDVQAIKLDAEGQADNSAPCFVHSLAIEG
jgi:hypothetical protein